MTLDWTKGEDTGSTEATPNAVALEDSAVVLTVDLAKAPEEEAVDQTYTKADVSYTKGTDPIRDLAGNDAAAFTKLEDTEWGDTLPGDKVDVEAAGTPAVVPATVTGGREAGRQYRAAPSHQQPRRRLRPRPRPVVHHRQSRPGLQADERGVPVHRFATGSGFTHDKHLFC